MTYTVQPGDSLSKIAQKFYGNTARYAEILDANPSITDEDLIYVGQVLEIPGTGTMPTTTPTPTPFPTTMPVVEKPQMTKTVMIVFALAAIALGYLVMKHFAEKKGIAPVPAANPEEEDVEVIAEDDDGDVQEEIAAIEEDV